jgi:prepilin-type N-terminal cleavage/methylation domain-containing protein
MTEDGYTLVEMLVAMLIIGLAIGGVTESTRVLALIQNRATRMSDAATSTHAAEESLAALFARQGPFRSDVPTSLVGQPRRLTFPCQGRICGAALRDVADGSALDLNLSGARVRHVMLTGLRALTFNYVDAKSTGQAWPPANPSDWRLLRAVSISSNAAGDPIPLAMARLWIEQPAACQPAETCRAPH